jgi:hypothetical protein
VQKITNGRLKCVVEVKRFAAGIPSHSSLRQLSDRTHNRYDAKPVSIIRDINVGGVLPRVTAGSWNAENQNCFQISTVRLT